MATLWQSMNRRRLAAAGVVFGAALLLLTTVAVLGPPSDEAGGDTPGACATVEAQRFVVGAALADLGFSVNEDLRFEDSFDLTLPGVSDRGAGSFASEAVTTREGLVAFLNSEDQAATAVRGGVLAEVPEEQHERLLSGEGWVGVQFLVDIEFTGNTTYVNGTVGDAGHREVASGDIWWFYVGEDCTVFTNVGVRGPCGNLEFAPPVPKGSPEPPAPGQPPAPPSTPPGSTPPPSNPPTTTPGGKDYERTPEGVRTPVSPETTRPAAPTTAPPSTSPPNTSPATTVEPVVPNNPTCPGGSCPSHPSPPPTEAPPATVPPTTAPPSTSPPSGPPGSG